MQQIEPENICLFRYTACCENAEVENLCSNCCLSLKMMTVSVKNICLPNVPAVKEMSMLC